MPGSEPEDAQHPLSANDDHEDGLPDEAEEAAPRLAQLSGRVVRVTRLLEVHVPYPVVFLRGCVTVALPAEDPRRRSG